MVRGQTDYRQYSGGIEGNEKEMEKSKVET